MPVHGDEESSGDDARIVRRWPEVDLGKIWTDKQDPSEQGRVSYNPGSGELYAASRPDGTVEVLARYRDEQEATWHITRWERLAQQPAGLNNAERYDSQTCEDSSGSSDLDGEGFHAQKLLSGVFAIGVGNA